MIRKFFSRDGLRAIVALLLVTVVAAGARASFIPDTAWSGTSGSWGTANNWDPRIPLPTDNAGINNGGTAQVANTADADYLYLGYEDAGGSTGTGTVEQSGGTVNIGGGLTLGDASGSTGYYELIDGNLNTAGLGITVGQYGEGHFTQYGGINSISSGAGHFTVGSEDTSTGSYELLGGQLHTGDVKIGDNGSGTFLQDDDNSLHEISVGLHIGDSTHPFSVSTYTLGAGELWLKPSTEYPFNSSIAALVGDTGTGEFIQNGGTIDYEAADGSAANFTLIVGSGENSDGAYDLNDGLLSATNLRVGDMGLGVFTQSGGTANLAGELSVGQASSGDGQYVLEAGTLIAETAVIGNEGVGLFTQTGGENLITWGLTLGAYGESMPGGIGGFGTAIEIGTGGAQGDGTYQLDDGLLSCNSLAVGQDGIGTFNHFGGTNDVFGTITLAQGMNSMGTYTLDALAVDDFGDPLDELTAGEIVVGESGHGIFTHSDGNNIVYGDLTIALGMEAIGEYELSADAELSAANASIGLYGTGYFTQGGDSINEIDGVLAMGVLSHPIAGIEGDGNYELNDFATLSATDQFVGYGARGSFVQNGGSNTVYEKLVLGHEAGSEGTYQMFGGSLEVAELFVGLDGNGWLDIDNPDAEIFITSLLYFGPDSQFTAASGSTIHMTGSAFENESVAPTDLTGLSNLTLIFEGGEDLDPFEVGGAVDGGFIDNFALGAMIIGSEVDDGHVVLVDHIDNGNWASGDECLYLHSLEILDGSTLDLNGLRLFIEGDSSELLQTYLDNGWLFDSLGGEVLLQYDADNNWTTTIPEPTTGCLLLAAAFFLFGNVRGRRR